MIIEAGIPEKADLHLSLRDTYETERSGHSEKAMLVVRGSMAVLILKNPGRLLPSAPSPRGGDKASPYFMKKQYTMLAAESQVNSSGRIQVQAHPPAYMRLRRGRKNARIWFGSFGTSIHDAQVT